MWQKRLLLAMLALLLVFAMLPVAAAPAYAAAGDTLAPGEVGIIVDEQAAGVVQSGTFLTVENADAYNGSFLFISAAGASSPQSLTYTLSLPEDGLYDFYVRKPAANKWYDGNVPYTITSESGQTVVNNVYSANQTTNWIKLGSDYPFLEGQSYTVLAGGAGYTTYPSPTGGNAFDAIKLIKTGELPAEPPEESAYFANMDAMYRDFAPGIINGAEGTIEMTVRIDKPYAEFGNTWDFLFSLIPEQTGPGNTLISAFIPPPQTKPSDSSYEQPLTFFVRNGDGGSTAMVTANPSSVAYTVGQPFNMAFAWKMGSGGYVAIYMNGSEIARTSTSLPAVQEKYMPYDFTIERGNPYNVSNLKISTKALGSGELESSTSSFSRGTDTSLLADITYGQPIQADKYVTPWHTASQYSVAKPVFRNEQQVYYADEAVIYPVATVNYGTAPKTYTVSFKAIDPYGQVAFTTNRTVTVPADGQYRIEELPLPEIGNQVSLWQLETTVSSGANDSIVYKSAISKIARNDTSVPDGSYADYYGQHIGTRFDMMSWSKMGATITRAWEDGTVFLWNRIEPTKGNFTWEQSDAYVARAAAANLDVMAVLGYPSTWASTRPPVSEIPAAGFENSLQYRAERYVPKDIQTVNGVPGTGEDWSNYVYQTMKRYAGQVKYWEIMNEPNFHPPKMAASFSGTTAEYILMLRLAREQADRVKSEYLQETGQPLELYITSGGFASNASVTDRQMVLDVLQEPAASYYDIFVVHGYEGTGEIADVLAAFSQAKQRHPNLELWQGEVYPIRNTYVPWKTYETASNYMSFMAAGASRYIHMGIPSEDAFITRHTQSPTEAFQTVAVLQNHIRKVDQYIGAYTGFTGSELLAVNHHMLRADGKYVSVLSAYDLPLVVHVANPGSIVSIQDTYGSDVAMATEGGAGTILKKNTLLIVSDEPLQLTSVEGEVPVSLLRNGGFEQTSGDWIGWPVSVIAPNWTMGWQRGTYGTHAYISQNPAYEGSFAMEFNSAGAPDNRTFVTQNVQLPGPGTYVLSARFKKLQGGADVQPELNIWDGTSDHQAAPVTLTNEYALYSTTYVATETSNLNIIINLGIYAGIGKVLADNVSLDLVPENVEITMDNSDETGVTLIGNWDNTRLNAKANKGNFALNLTKTGNDSVVYTPTIPLSGMYDVSFYVHYTSGPSDAPYTIRHAAGTDTVMANQALNGERWITLGNYPFAAGTSGSVTVTNAHTTGTFILADAVRFTRTGALDTDLFRVKGTATGPSGTVNAGATFATSLGVAGVAESVYGNVYAQDTTIVYDPAAVEFVSAESSRSGYAVVSVDNDVPGELRILAASQGAAGAIEADGAVMQLTWRAKLLGASTTTAMTATTTYADRLGRETSDDGVTFNVSLLSNLEALGQAIARAQAVLQPAIEGTGIGQYPAGSKAVLASAITAAQSVYADSGASYEAIADAAATLDIAVAAFQAQAVVRKPEDINGDNRISIGDLALVAANYGKTSASADWATVSICDVNGDGKIDLLDLVAVALKV